jgi:DNA-binding NarL/FixJ family response regulator
MKKLAGQAFTMEFFFANFFYLFCGILLVISGTKALSNKKYRLHMEKIRIVVVDDHTLVRETWSEILNSDPRFAVIAQAGTGEQAIELARKLHPDIVIMDVNLPGMNGIDATEQVISFSPGTKVLGVSMHTQPAYARKMMQNGASGYVTKNSSREEMVEAIVEICKGNKYICTEIKNILSEQMVNGDDPQKTMNSLSHREIQIVAFIQKGLSSKEIADLLFVSVKTIEVHRYNILRKLNLKNAAALVNFVNKHQLDIGTKKGL